MCAAVLRRRVTIRRIEVALVSHPFEICLELELLGRGPVDAVCVERIREIDYTIRGKNERFLRHYRKNENENNNKRAQTLHVECSLALGFCYLHVNPQTKQGSILHANRNDWTRSHGRQHGAAPAARRPRVCCQRSQP